MTLIELQQLVKDLSLNDNAKVCLLVGYNPNDLEYYLVQVDATGRLVTV